MWRQFDAGEIAEEFARIAGLGLDTVRFFVRWDDFQPQPDMVDDAMLARLEAVAGLAQDAGLRAIAALCGYAHGALLLPPWARSGNLYAGPLLDAQLLLARRAAERLGAHPALAAWDLGHAFSNVRQPARGKVSTGDHGGEPVAEREVAAWSRRLSEALGEASGRPVTAGTHAGDLTEDRNIRLGSLCAPLGFASMQGSNIALEFARGRLDPEALPFLAALAAGFSYKPVLVTGFGNPTCSPEVFATSLCLTEAENAAWCGAVLERLHADGRLGALWWCWADYEGELPPHERSYGIVRSDGSEKPVAAALSAFARQGRSVIPAADMPTISSTYYYRTLPTSARTLYDAFLGHVEERRKASPNAQP